MDITERATMPREIRAFTVAPVEIRADEKDGLTFEGIASVVDTAYTVNDMFGEFSETMARGAFNKSLKEKDDVRLLVNHEGIPLARTKSGTLKLDTVPDLRARTTLDDANPSVQEVRSAMARGDLDQMSIAFRVTRQEWNGDYTERLIREVQLFDVSVVTYPASPTTSASLRSLDDALRSLRADDLDPDEVRRGITYLESLLATEEEERQDVISPLLAEFWAKRLPAA